MKIDNNNIKTANCDTLNIRIQHETKQPSSQKTLATLIILKGVNAFLKVTGFDMDQNQVDLHDYFKSSAKRRVSFWNT